MPGARHWLPPGYWMVSAQREAYSSSHSSSSNAPSSSKEHISSSSSPALPSHTAGAAMKIVY
ncbi:hypothetical protein E2C01_071216 [Portunus trituberculatus]|uniref:Uncharacterized protein n=1 Tax=Portunus trituberculatus TaxID=210409 RepID=A0A5B7I7M5_PORTR|nr:hypothetical protein [Portunus trituberculatus]